MYSQHNVMVTDRIRCVAALTTFISRMPKPSTNLSHGKDNLIVQDIFVL